MEQAYNYPVKAYSIKVVILRTVTGFVSYQDLLVDSPSTCCTVRSFKTRISEFYY